MVARTLVLTVCFVCSSFVASCKKKQDPRCVQVAESSRMAAEEVMEEKYSGDDLEELRSQLDSQMTKVEKQCQEMLADDDTGLWDRWADCMVAATSLEEVQECKSTE